jgi:hypothetical protein
MSRFTAVAVAALAAGLLAPATSLAGGFATVGLSSFPEDVGPGDEWVVDLTVLQHGVTPLADVEPRVMVAPAGAGTPHAFDARPTDRPGVYRARVEFESAGDWNISVDDGFAAVHEFGVVQVGDGGDGGDDAAAGAGKSRPATSGPAQSTADSGPTLGTALGIAALAGLLAAAFAQAWGNRQGPSPASG